MKLFLNPSSVALSTIVAQLAGFSAQAAAYNGPAGFLTTAANQKLFAQYCTGTANSTATPGVNYANAEISQAAKKLQGVADPSFYFYGGITRSYGLKDPSTKQLVNPPASAPKGTTPSAHAYLVILCGEFRDRAGLIQDKVRWINNINKLPVGAQKPIDPKKNIWSQVAAESYGPYLTISAAYYDAKFQAKGAPYQVGSFSVDRPTEGQNACETKFIFSEYVAKKVAFKDLATFNAGLAKYSKLNCTASDLNTYYDFRGDSNFKPNSPESNGMIWYSTSMAGACSSPTKAAPANAGAVRKITDADCANYFKAPFRSRWNAARAGLGTWILRDTKHDSVFSSEGQNVTVLPRTDGALRPFDFRFQLASSGALADFLPKFNTNPSGFWSQPDMGLNSIAALGAGTADLGLLYSRIRDAVNRHTDWYNSSWDDGLALPGKNQSQRPQAYSPFVASSYEMSASNAFTAAGYTVPGQGDGRKHWMFVFKIKKENWYNSSAAAAGKPVDFDRMWFDETSMGTNSLAKSEKAWDRLGTALEGEFDSILYLHNIEEGGNVSSDGLPQN